MQDNLLIYDWDSRISSASHRQCHVDLFDETLRDGLQSVSLKFPSLPDRLQLIELMLQLGIRYANLGFPGASAKHYDEALWLLNEVTKARLPMRFACAARTHPDDIQAVINLSQQAGVAIELHVFLGSSPVRIALENWNNTNLCDLTKAAILQGRKANLAVSFVTEDTARSSPVTLEMLFKLAIAEGASRLILCDTVGGATPTSVKELVTWTRNLIVKEGASIVLDWHGHNDRGLATINALAAVEAGCNRIHATALGIGERCGNVAMEQLLVNLKLLNFLDNDLTALTNYCHLVSHMLNMAIPVNQPIIGKDAFSTSTGVHAAAILKAIEKNHFDLADIVYSGVPASMIGRKQEILVGPMSGKANVVAWLKKHNIFYNEELVNYILQIAKNSDNLLHDSILHTICDQWQVAAEVSAV